jgi:hypothetical protein
MRNRSIIISILSFLIALFCTLIILLQGTDSMTAKHWVELIGLELLAQLWIHYMTKDEDIH